MHSFWRQRVPDSGILMGFKNVHFQVPSLCIIKDLCYNLSDGQGTRKLSLCELFDMRPWSAKADSLTWNCREAKRVRVCSDSEDFRIDQLQESKS